MFFGGAFDFKPEVAIDILLVIEPKWKQTLTQFSIVNGFKFFNKAI